MTVTIESNAIIEAAARALRDESYMFFDMDEAGRLATAMLAAVTPLIRAAIQLEATAAAARELHLSPEQTAILIANAIRSLKEQP